MNLGRGDTGEYISNFIPLLEPDISRSSFVIEHSTLVQHGCIIQVLLQTQQQNKLQEITDRLRKEGFIMTEN
jgi:hypothetical protein